MTAARPGACTVPLGSGRDRARRFHRASGARGEAGCAVAAPRAAPPAGEGGGPRMGHFQPSRGGWAAGGGGGDVSPAGDRTFTCFCCTGAIATPRVNHEKSYATSSNSALAVQNRRFILRFSKSHRHWGFPGEFLFDSASQTCRWFFGGSSARITTPAYTVSTHWVLAAEHRRRR